MNEKNLDIKIVMKKNEDYVKNTPGGGDPKNFCEINDELRNSLGSSLIHHSSFIIHH